MAGDALLEARAALAAALESIPQPLRGKIASAVKLLVAKEREAEFAANAPMYIVHRELLASMPDRDLKLKDVAEIIGCSVGAVSSMRTRLGLPRLSDEKSKKAKASAENIREMQEAGLTIPEISPIVGDSKRAIEGRLYRYVGALKVSARTCRCGKTFKPRNPSNMKCARCRNALHRRSALAGYGQ